MPTAGKIHLRMDPELIRILKRECLEQQITVSKFVESLAARWLLEQAADPERSEAPEREKAA